MNLPLQGIQGVRQTSKEYTPHDIIESRSLKCLSGNGRGKSRFAGATLTSIVALTMAGIPSQHREQAHRLLAEARAAADLPALAAGDAVLMPATALSNTFICQPQQQNMHGRVFGGFLMR